MTYILEIGDRRRLKAGIRVLHHTGHRHPAPVGGSNFAERAAPRERLRREMEVAGRRLDVAMAEQALHHKTPIGAWDGGFAPGLDPARGDYASFADFSDPDGNSWVLQERGYRNV